MIIASICCRKGSKGVPGKNTKMLFNKPLVEYTIDAARNCDIINDVVVSTDDEIVKDIAIRNGVHSPFERPEALASDSASKWDVFRHIVSTYEELNSVEVDYLVDLDVTVPLKTTEDIKRAIELAIGNNQIDVVITGYEPERNPYFNMVELEMDGFATLVKKSDKPITRRQDAPIVYSLTPAAFVIKRSALWDYDHWSEARMQISPMPVERSVDIDRPIDFEFVEFLMNRVYGR